MPKDTKKVGVDIDMISERLRDSLRRMREGTRKLEDFRSTVHGIAREISGIVFDIDTGAREMEKLVDEFNEVMRSLYLDD